MYETYPENHSGDIKKLKTDGVKNEHVKINVSSAKSSKDSSARQKSDEQDCGGSPGQEGMGKHGQKRNKCGDDKIAT
jgi:uncharacterized low-complexity protein